LSDFFAFFTGSISDSESDGNSFALAAFGLAVDFGGRPRFLGTFSSSELSDFFYNGVKVVRKSEQMIFFLSYCSYQPTFFLVTFFSGRCSLTASRHQSHLYKSNPENRVTIFNNEDFM